MAGAAITAPGYLVKPDKVIGTYLIKNAEVINEGDLIDIDTNGFIVAASKTQGAAVKAEGIAFFDDNNGPGQTARTGDGSTVKCGLAKRARIKGMNGTLVPGIGKGKPVYLGPVPTTTVSNYTCTQSTTAGDLIQTVGTVDSDGTTLVIDVDSTNQFAYQGAATSVVTYG